GWRSCSRSRRPSPCRSNSRACGSAPPRPGACVPAGDPGLVLLLAAASEGNVVVAARAAEVLVAGSCGRRDELALAALAAAFAAATEELDAVGDDLDRLPLGAVLRFPLAPVEPAVDADRASLGEVLRTALALVAPDGDVEVIRLVPPV